MELDCGIRCGRIEAWLGDDLALSREGGRWAFRCPEGACVIELQPLEDRVLGAVSLERTGISLAGDEAAIEAFMRLFTLRFISAGG